LETAEYRREAQRMFANARTIFAQRISITSNMIDRLNRCQDVDPIPARVPVDRNEVVI
tara:strand:- start:2668 stop:2841 length:174 start_codon:yes stop_codon:yes gene_type:complete